MQKTKMLCFIFVVVTAAACSRTAAAPSPQPSPAQQPLLPQLQNEAEAQAQKRYQAGEIDLKRGLYQDAIKAFEAVRTEHPYSRYAAISELRIADTHLKRAQYLEAIDGYRSFLRFHPGHPEAAYALGKVGEAYFAQIPKDFWLMPPAAEKDLGHVKEAIAAYEDLLAKFPQASETEMVQQQLRACQKKLADHEMYVAQFYFNRRMWPGAVLRLNGILKDYPGVGYDADALYLLTVALGHQGQLDQALACVTRLLADYPDTQAGRRGGRLLEQLEGKMR